MGGDKEDSALFIKLKKLIPDFEKTAAAVLKAIAKKKDYEENKARTEDLSNFGQYYNDFSYR